MLAVIEREIVDNRKWITKEEFINNLAIAQSFPGILAINVAILIGNKLKGKRGGFTAALGNIIPSFTIILLIAIFFSRVYERPLVERIFKGIRPAVVALIISPALTAAKNAKINYKNAIIPIAIAGLITYLGISPIVFIVIGIAFGLGYCYFTDKSLNKKG